MESTSQDFATGTKRRRKTEDAAPEQHAPGPKLKPVTLWAREALVEAGGDVVEATSLMLERVLNDRDFIRENMSDVIRVACYESISGTIRSERRTVWMTPQPTAAERKAQISAMATATIRTLYDFPLLGGIRLGDATREDVVKAARFYGEQATDMRGKAVWLGMVAKAVPDGTTVKAVLTAEKLARLRNSAEATK